MANNCLNFVFVENENIIDKLSENRNGFLFKTLFDYSVEEIEEHFGIGYDYPIKEISFEEGNSSLTFSTPWTPYKKFCLKLSEIFQTKVRLEYEEAGNNFAGWSVYENGAELEDEEFSFLEGVYKLDSYDLESWLSYAEISMDDSESFEDFMKDKTYIQDENVIKEIEEYYKDYKNE